MVTPLPLCAWARSTSNLGLGILLLLKTLSKALEATELWLASAEEVCVLRAVQLFRSGEFVQSVKNNAKNVACLLLDMLSLCPPLKKILHSKFNPVAHYS